MYFQQEQVDGQPPCLERIGEPREQVACEQSLIKVTGQQA